MISAGFLVRVTGFEPAASWSQTEAENFFRTFLAIFYRFRSYSVTLLPSFESPFPPVPRASVVIHVVKGGFSGDSEKCGKPADARVSRGSGVLALAGRMDADTLPNHALYHLSYTRL